MDNLEPTPEERIQRARARREAKANGSASSVPLPPPPIGSNKLTEKLADNNSFISLDLEQNLLSAGRLLVNFSTAILLFTGLVDVSSQSKGADSWFAEDSFSALQLRSMGYLKIAIGLGAYGFMLGGLSLISSNHKSNKSDDEP